MDQVAGPSRPSTSADDHSLVVLEMEMAGPNQNRFPEEINLSDSDSLEFMQILGMEMDPHQHQKNSPYQFPLSEDFWNISSVEAVEAYSTYDFNNVLACNPSTLRPPTRRINIPDDAFNGWNRLTVTNVEAQHVESWNLPHEQPHNIVVNSCSRTVITVVDNRNSEQETVHMDQEYEPKEAAIDSARTVTNVLDNHPITQEAGYNNREEEPDLRSDHGHGPVKQWELKCTVCYQNVLGGQACLDAHTKNCHNIECKCGSRYKHRRQLQKHIKDEKIRSCNGGRKQEHGYKIPGRIHAQLECDFCNLTFYGRPPAVAHRISAHPAEVKQWELERKLPKRRTQKKE